MISEREFLRKLAKAKTEDEKNWLTTKRLIDSLSEDLQGLVYNAAIPHWFDSKILLALNPELGGQIKSLYSKLQKLPFVEPFEGRGYNIHELTRRLILKYIWGKQKRTYLSLSQNLVEFYEDSMSLAQKKINRKIKDVEKKKVTKKSLREFQQWAKKNPEVVNAVSASYQIEYIYHLVIAQPKKGADRIRDTGWQFHNKLDYSFVELNSLINSIGEHAVAGRIKGRALGWESFFRGLLCSYRYEYVNAKTFFIDLISQNYSDNDLNADSRFRLGTVHMSLSELPEARVRYEEALPLYRATQDKHGEANCIISIGTIHKRMSELPEARARYEEALSLYRITKDELGEANCIMLLGDVHTSLSELPEARARYEEALSIYRANENKLGEANCIKSLGDVHVLLSELSEARAQYEEALSIYRAIENKLGEANCVKSLGDVQVELKDFESAVTFYEQAIKIAKTIAPALESRMVNALANAYEKQKDYTKAIEFYTKAIELFPNHAFIWRNRAELYLKRKDAENASRDLETATKLQPGGAYLSLHRGELALLFGKYPEALEHFNVALKLFPRMNDAYFGIGIVHLQMKNYTEALNAYQKGLDVTNSPSELDDAIEELEQLHSEKPLLEGTDKILGLLKGFFKNK